MVLGVEELGEFDEPEVRPKQKVLAVRTEPVTLRWVLFHLIEETARHNGHIDILRELADGARGI